MAEKRKAILTEQSTTPTIAGEIAKHAYMSIARRQFILTLPVQFQPAVTSKRGRPFLTATILDCTSEEGHKYNDLKVPHIIAGG